MSRENAKDLKGLLYEAEEALGIEVSEIVPSAQRVRKIILRKYRELTHKTVQEAVKKLCAEPYLKSTMHVTNWHPLTVNALLKALQKKGFQVKFIVNGKEEKEDCEEFNSPGMLSEKYIIIKV